MGEREYERGVLSMEPHPQESWLLRYTFRGYLELAAARQIVAWRADAFADHPVIEEFHDWWDMTGYDSLSRRLLTDHTLAHRARLARVHLLFRSQLVRMGVAAASIPLGRLLVSHASPERFAERLEASLARGAPAES